MVYHRDGILLRCRRVSSRRLDAWFGRIRPLVHAVDRGPLEATADATLTVLVEPKGPSHNELAAIIETDGHKINSCAARYAGTESEWRFDIHWQAAQKDASLPQFLERLAGHSGVKEVRWTPSFKQQ